jgi:GNAT superfamily N-acetyltransferase
MYEIRSMNPEMDGFHDLLDESLIEGHRMLLRLQENWFGGKNTFSRPGEKIVAVLQGNKLVGVCGRRMDPYVGGRRVGRVRHLYVAKVDRRKGVGALLLRSVIDGAGEFFDIMNTRAPAEAFRFYESLGFERVADNEFVTHRLKLGGRQNLQQVIPASA